MSWFSRHSENEAPPHSPDNSAALAAAMANAAYFEQQLAQARGTLEYHQNSTDLAERVFIPAAQANVNQILDQLSQAQAEINRLR